MTELEMDLVIANARIAILEKMLAEAQKKKCKKCCHKDVSQICQDDAVDEVGDQDG
jgi:hypothetical protein